ncbi:hypothetical protein AB0G04_19155 [Actinoplanes sp. NPDC023801]|uniref:hypothetical protein n=1 Tax=Actinoplanes sp. NPDC023801 TaxID=3154595 RepID=UPI0033EA414B
MRGITSSATGRRLAQLLLVIGLAVGAYAALNAFGQAARADGVLPDRPGAADLPAPVRKLPAVIEADHRTSKPAARTDTALRNAKTAAHRVTGHETLPSEQRKTAPVQLGKRRSPAPVAQKRKAPVARTTVRPRLAAPADARRPVTSRAAGAAVRQLTAHAARAKIRDLTTRSVPAEVRDLTAHAVPAGVRDLAARAVPGGVGDLTAATVSAIRDLTTSAVPEGIRNPAAEAVSAAVTVVPEPPDGATVAVPGQLTPPSTGDGKAGPVSCRTPAPPDGQRASETTGGPEPSSVAPSGHRPPGSELRPAPATPSPPASPPRPDNRSAGATSLRDSGGGASTIGVMPSSWWPGLPAATVMPPANTSTTGRSVRYCGPPS